MVFVVVGIGEVVVLIGTVVVAIGWPVEVNWAIKTKTIALLQVYPRLMK